MEAFVEQVYLGELRQQCVYCIGAVQRVIALLADPQPTVSEFFCEMSSLLQDAAAVSKILWPPGSGCADQKARADQRGDYLRQGLDVAADHPLRRRTLRDHIEHFDYRLDDWVESSPNRIIVDGLLGPRSAIGGNVVNDTDILRSYDPQTHTYVFRGESHDIQELVNGVRDVLAKADARLNVLSPDVA